MTDSPTAICPLCRRTMMRDKMHEIGETVNRRLVCGDAMAASCRRLASEHAAWLASRPTVGQVSEPAEPEQPPVPDVRTWQGKGRPRVGADGELLPRN